jgi:hypothetical protein
MGGEKRRAPRERKRAKVDLGRGPLFTVDVSVGGFCAETAHVLFPGSELTGSISYHGEAFPFRGRVQWARAGDVRLGIRGRMGVQFSTVDPGFHGLLGPPPKAH